MRTRNFVLLASCLFLGLAAAQNLVTKQRQCDIAQRGPCCLLSEAEAGVVAYHTSAGSQLSNQSLGEVCHYLTSDESHGDVKIVMPRLHDIVTPDYWWRAIPGISVSTEPMPIDISGTNAIFVPADGTDNKISAWIIFSTPFPFAIGTPTMKGTTPWGLTRTASVYALTRIKQTVSEVRARSLIFGKRG